MSDVKRYVTTCDCMSQAAWGDYVRYDDYAALEAELAKLRAGQEPVAEVAHCNSATGHIQLLGMQRLNPGTKLYTTPQPSAVPDGLPLVLAGVLFDFAGFLTTRPKVIKVGATANASPMADLAKEFSELRGLSLDDAAVLSWQDLLAAIPSAPKADDPVKQMLLEALEKVDSEHEILGRMKTCELRRGRGSFGIAVMSDELALDWQSHQKDLERLIGLRLAAIAAARQEGGKA